MSVFKASVDDVDGGDPDGDDDRKVRDAPEKKAVLDTAVYDRSRCWRQSHPESSRLTPLELIWEHLRRERKDSRGHLALRIVSD